MNAGYPSWHWRRKTWTVKNPVIVIRLALFFSPGITSRIRLYKPSSKSTEIGIKGIKVNRNMIAGGMAMTRLKEIADALSVIPTVFTCLIKKSTTSYNGIPLKPGKEVNLLLPTI
jgi:hypothetical protein